VDIIEQYPNICSAFYYFDHPDLERKSELIDKIYPAEHLSQEGR